MQPRLIRDAIVRPVLMELGLYSPAAEQLVMGTGAHESGGFETVLQVNGPAVSYWQIEPVTYVDLCTRTLPRLASKLPQVAGAVIGMMPRRYAAYAPADQLVRDQGLAAAVCRLLYWRAPEPLPAAGDVAAMAALWKLRYNTPQGAGHPDQWLAAWRKYCAAIY